MKNEVIHIHKQSNVWRFIALVIPGVVFILALVIYLTVTSYKAQRAASFTEVLGTQK